MAIKCYSLMRWYQHTELFVHLCMCIYIASSPNQQPIDGHVTPLGHIIVPSSHPVFFLTSWSCVLCWESTNTNFMVFVFIGTVIEPIFHRTWGQHHCTTEAVNRLIEHKTQMVIYHVDGTIIWVIVLVFDDHCQKQ